MKEIAFSIMLCVAVACAQDARQYVVDGPTSMDAVEAGHELLRVFSINGEYPGFTTPINVDAARRRRGGRPDELGATAFRVETPEVMEFQPIRISFEILYGTTDYFDSVSANVSGDTVRLSLCIRRAYLEMGAALEAGTGTVWLPGLERGDYVFLMLGAEHYDRATEPWGIAQPIFVQHVHVSEERLYPHSRRHIREPGEP